MIVQACRRNKLDVIALTDHNEIAGALRLRDIAPFRVIVGEEIETNEGEVIGLFLRQRIPPGMSLDSTVRAIKEQGGIVYLPHPFETRRKGISQPALKMLGTNQVDVWEIFNARSRDSKAVEDFRVYAEDRGLRLAAGSDAHMPRELGRAYTLVPSFETPQDLLDSLEQADFVCEPISFLHRLCLNYKTRQGLRALHLWMSGGLP